MGGAGARTTSMSTRKLLTLAGGMFALAALFLANRGPAGLNSSATPVAGSRPSGGRAPDPASGEVCAPEGQAPGSRLAQAAADRAARTDAVARAVAFNDWLTSWRRADADGQATLAAQGRDLAAARRGALLSLMREDPRLALQLSVPPGLQAELPAEVRAQLERRIDARGDFEVGIACLGTETWVERSVVVDGTRYDAHVFGRRSRVATKTGLPLHGIVLDRTMALEETAYRVLDDGEKASLGLAADRLAVNIGGHVVALSASGELAALEERLNAAEAASGPALDLPLQADTGDPMERLPGRAAVNSPASWINGDKRVLWLKLEFPDELGAPATDEALAASAAAVNEFYQGTSHGRTSMTFVNPPGLIRLPRDKSVYNASSSSTGQLRDDAKAAAKAYDAANGGTGLYDPDRYDRWVLVFRKMAAYTFGGLGNLGGPVVWLNGGVGAGVTGHELGHNQSLDHSHAWLPSGTSPIGAGTHVEYGDAFDRMGSSGSGPSNFFNVAQKHKLGYLADSDVTTVAASGTYRLTRHDHKDAAGIRALRVGAANVEYEYWIEHRRLGPTALTSQQLDRLQNGILLRWGPQKLPKFVPGPGSYLLDMTPGSAGGTNDAPLRIGESFTDPDAGITFRPLAAGGTAPNEYIDVEVRFGATGANRNPSIIAEAPAGPIAARTNLVFSATASDPDNDAVYFRWDFGDRSVQPNLPSVSNRYLKGGVYPIAVSAHDGKGGIAVRTYNLTVSDPLTAWTRRGAAVSTTLLNDVIHSGTRFVAVGSSSVILTSADGLTWARATVPAGLNLSAVATSGTRYAAVGTLASNPATSRGVVVRSEDGLTWTTSSLPAGSGSVFGLAYGAGRFVAVGELGLIYTSSDAVNWTAAPTGISSTLRAVTFADGLFVATGDAGRVLTSPDGQTWANRSIASTAGFWGVARHEGSWYVNSGATVFSSSDATTWSRVTVAGLTNLGSYKLYSLAGVLLGGFNEGTIQFSETGQTWAKHQIDATANMAIRAATHGNGLVVAVGSAGIIYTTAAPAQVSPPLPAPSLRLEADSLKLSVDRRNLIAAGGTGYSRLELYANGTKVSEIDGQSGIFSWKPTAIGNYTLLIRGVNADGSSAVSASYPAQVALSTWSWRNPLPAGTDLNSAVRVDGKWWIVGNTGTFVTMDAAGRFAPVDFATTQRLTSIAHGNGRFVVTAPFVDAASREEIGSIWTSTDGFNWTALLTTSLEAIGLNYATYAGGQWLALSTNGVVLISSDGLSWSRQNTPVSTQLTGAAHGNGLYVVVGFGGRILTSTDGLRWTERASGVTSDLRAVTFSGGTFVAVGAAGVILTSADGQTWVRRSAGFAGALYAATFAQGSFIVAGDNGTVLVSPDGSTWSSVNLGGRISRLLAAAAGDGEALLVGRDGEVYSSATPTAWQRRSSGSADSRNAVIQAAGKFVAVGAANDTRVTGSPAVVPISVSADGVTWTRANPNAAFGTLNDVAYGNGRFIAVGDNSRIFTSADALTWTQLTTTFNSTFSCVAIGPGLIVVASTGQAIYTSADGSAWTQRINGTNVAFRGAAYGNGRYVVVGDGGGIYTSADGIAWTRATSGVTTQLLNVSWFDAVGFIASGASGVMLGSRDGQVWDPIETGVTDTIYSLASTPVGFVAPAGTAGTLLLSADGINWTIGTLPVDQAVRGVAANATTIVAVGDFGTTLNFDLVDPTPGPVIVAQPAGQAVTPGSPVRLAVSVDNASGGAYQWYRDGVPLVGANTPTLVLPSIGAGSLGSYTVRITTPTGTALSAPATVALANSANPGRLVNLSILTSLDAPGDAFTLGYVVGGSGTAGAKPLVIRAAGPSLGALGVGGALDDPRIELYAGQTKTGENDNWGGSAALANAMSAVGAFAYTGPGSKDAAASVSITARDNSVGVSSANNGTGLVIAELYDATPNAGFMATTPRLVNVSVLKHLGTGMTAGFVVGGATARNVLVRAVGPTLGAAPFGVPGVVADPQLALFSGQTKIAENDNWGGGAALTAAFSQVGAFALPAGSKDAALLVNLQPGNYTVQVSGTGGTSGIALIEVYEAP
jgi:hypothetical protein